jgi:hypothetical protein
MNDNNQQLADVGGGGQDGKPFGVGKAHHGNHAEH